MAASNTVMKLLLKIRKYYQPNIFCPKNYPNPFNPSTTIEFTIPQKEFVSIIIYDILGNEVATLVDEEKAPGSYEVSFNAADMVSGVYIYSLRANNFVQTRKMILMK